MECQKCDLLIVGGGPAGLAAGINGSSEGLKVAVIDSGPQLGGQASRTSLIENYPGFAEGISGEALLGQFILQAEKFGAALHCPQTAVSLRADGPKRIVTTDDDQVFEAGAVILALGLSYRKLGVEGISAHIGKQVRYGSPTRSPSTYDDGTTICVVGGANSAAQAATYLAQNPGIHVKMLVRNKLGVGMSKFLADRIQDMPNIEVLEGTEVTKVIGGERLEALRLQRGDSTVIENYKTDYMYIFIGASPKTFWLQGSVAMDEKKFILTGPKLVTGDIWPLQHQRQALPLETSIPGVFACGDVRLDSVKRFGAATGDGITALSMVHQYRRLVNNNH